jgi:hypothetical protein
MSRGRLAAFVAAITLAAVYFGPAMKATTASFIASLLSVFGHASAAYTNSCSNVDVMGTWDESGLRESESKIFAVGTFRVAGEEDESKQPMFNLAWIIVKSLRNKKRGRARNINPRFLTEIRATGADTLLNPRI